MKPATLLIAIVLCTGMQPTARAQSLQPAAAVVYDVFVLPIEYRSSKDSVESPLRWEYIGRYSDRIPYCAPGRLQACQLIVDERDTDPAVGKTRMIKSSVRIISSLSADQLWYVTRYISTGGYAAIIRNEQAR